MSEPHVLHGPWVDGGGWRFRVTRNEELHDAPAPALEVWAGGGAWREVDDPKGERAVVEELARLSARVRELEALFVSEDAPGELLDAFRSADKPAALAMYRLLRERVLGLPSSLPEAVDRPALCVNCSRPESDHSHVGNLCSLGAGFKYTPWGAVKEGAMNIEWDADDPKEICQLCGGAGCPFCGGEGEVPCGTFSQNLDEEGE